MWCVLGEGCDGLFVVVKCFDWRCKVCESWMLIFVVFIVDVSGFMGVWGWMVVSKVVVIGLF